MDAITFILDEQSPDPLYLQVYRRLAQRIRSGELRDGEKLPSKRALATHLRISMSTVETAYDMLVTQGYVTARARSGYYANGIGDLIPDSPSVPVEREPEGSAPETYQYDFGAGAVDTSAFPYATWSKIAREVLSNGGALLTRGDVRGDECLRAAIAKYLKAFRGVNCRPDQIIVGAGMEYLMELIAGLVSGTLALENPCYPTTGRILKNLGRETRPIPLDSGGMSADKLEESDASIAYITPSHQFPMGIVMPVMRRLRLLQWAAQSENRYLIEDDYDSEFRYSGRPVPSMQGMDHADKVIYTGTFSRSIAPSIRIAYMVLPRRLLRRFMEKYGTYSSTVSRFEQHTLCRFIESGSFARHVNRMRLTYRRRRDIAVEALRGMTCAPVEIYGEQAGLHLIVQIDCPLPAESIASACRAQSIRLVPLSTYYAGSCPANAQKRLVLNFAGMDENTIRAGIAQLDLAVQTLLK